MAATATTHRYIVVADIAIVTTGKKPNGKAEWTRIPRGGLIHGAPDSETVANMLRQGSIMEVTSKAQMEEVRADLANPARSKYRLTARKAARNSGQSDPVLDPFESALPIPAPLPETDPAALVQEPADF